MNILFICDEYPPGKNGGIGTMVQVLGRELAKQGHGVYVVGLYSYRYGQADYEEDQGVKVWRLRFGLNLRVKATNRWYTLFLEKLPSVIRRNLNGKKAFNNFIEFIRKLIEKEKIDVIEVPDWNNFTFFIGFQVKWPAFKIPLVVKSHGSYSKICKELNKNPNNDFVQTDINLYKRADALVAVSNDTARSNEAIFHPARETRVLYNSVEIPALENERPRKAQTVVFTGALSEAKGVFQLMKAWNLVNEKFPGAELLVYGKGDTNSLKQLLNKRSLETVHFKGHVPRNELFNEMSVATASIFPSYSESFALAPLEAMAVGSPLIYTSRSSGPELVENGINGLLVDPGNVEEIAANIIKLVENKQLQHEYSVRGKQTILDKFTITRSALDHIDYYTSVINGFAELKKQNRK